MVSTIYVCRHGLRANLDPPPTNIDGDVPLSAAGEEQAAELSAHLVKIQPAIQRIYSSPFYRCLQTCSPTSKRLGLPIHVEAGLGEYYYLERPTHPVPAQASVLKSSFPDIDLSYSSKVPVSEDGESREALRERVQKAMDTLIGQTSEDVILIATHAAIKIEIGHVLANLEVRAGTCSLDRYDLDPETNTWACVYSGDTSFLKNGEQMHWSFDMHAEAGSLEDEKSRSNARVKLLVPLDMSGLPVAPKTGDLEIADLKEETPLFKIGRQVYEGQWSRVVGTEIYTDRQGDYIGKTRDRITLQPVQTDVPKKTKLADRIKEIDEQRARDRMEL
ncbi:Transcription factor tau subunit [Wickerhamiella sorbophila]|uniref:Transcription factor tau subunit n=1 Tax=Wickerhamiella sorbophila TaxID=45607 RepID=A0A2T0FFN7_9ASCO|nr:Transcription factor tau subunit [Wickerhamiella sorbophila]PRT53812.1 Transcription factor tau subunit [Wickerhamiella sorbophila]